MMRWKFAFLAVLALPLAASADGLFRGHGCAGGNCGGAGRGGLFAGGGGGGGGGGASNTGGQRHGFGFFQPPFQAAPWYLYWPYDQHFQMPAPINAPYFAPQVYGNPALNPYFAPVIPAPMGPAAGAPVPVGPAVK